jgi:asparagine synthase (glutamine-hydrolysing)
MCGIAGVRVFEGGEVVAAGLRRMGCVMVARGPDDEGLFIGPGVGLIHRRLSILDLSELGNCPMPNEDGSVQVLLNGEIYNWRELRAELLAHGHRFRSMSDSEVLSHGYEEWGENLFNRLRGMFALAIWDQLHARLLLARDRLGEKPLFYLRDRRYTLFASSIPALLGYDEKSRPLNPDAIVCCLSHSFIPATHTVWNGIEVFPPAHYGVINGDGELSLHRYWNFPDERPRAVAASVAEDEVERVIDDSVRRCLDADVPVGVFLSGGVDSSLVAALAAHHHQGLHSFSVGFEESAWSELDYARRVASHLGLKHHEIIVHPRDVLKILPTLVWHYGQPFGDAAAVPTYMVSMLARQQVKVCLSGDGGDESFAGYWRVQSGVYAARFAALVPPILRRYLVPPIAGFLGSMGTRVAALNTLSLATPGNGYTNSQSWHDTLAEVAGPALRPGLDHDRVACRVGRAYNREGATVIQRLLFDDFQVQLPDAYLTKVDVASMAASLEVRAPLLDVAVLESAWRLPDRMKLHWGQRKWLLKRIAARLVPREVVYRPKMGFALPLPEWFQGEVGFVLERLLKESAAEREGWIDSKRVIAELEDHRSGKRDNHNRLWLILCLELWFRIATGELDYHADISNGHLAVGRRRSDTSRRDSSVDGSLVTRSDSTTPFPSL